MTELHPRLAADTLALAEDDFVWVRYMNDARFPWLVIVPKAHDLREWFELETSSQQRLLTLVNHLSKELQLLTHADKMNLGALGNLVPQLHIHLIARHHDDACWPSPVWGQGKAQAYTANATPSWVTALHTFIFSEGLLHE